MRSRCHVITMAFAAITGLAGARTEKEQGAVRAAFEARIDALKTSWQSWMEPTKATDCWLVAASFLHEWRRIKGISSVPSAAMVLEKLTAFWQQSGAPLGVMPDEDAGLINTLIGGTAAEKDVIRFGAEGIKAVMILTEHVSKTVTGQDVFGRKEAELAQRKGGETRVEAMERAALIIWVCTWMPGKKFARGGDGNITTDSDVMEAFEAAMGDQKVWHDVQLGACLSKAEMEVVYQKMGLLPDERLVDPDDTAKMDKLKRVIRLLDATGPSAKVAAMAGESAGAGAAAAGGEGTSDETGLDAVVAKAVAAAMAEQRRGGGGGGNPARYTAGCFRCGRPGHSIKDCPQTSKLCYQCKKPGHEKAECKSAFRSRGDEASSRKRSAVKPTSYSTGGSGRKVNVGMNAVSVLVTNALHSAPTGSLQRLVAEGLKGARVKEGALADALAGRREPGSEWAAVDAMAAEVEQQRAAKKTERIGAVKGNINKDARPFVRVTIGGAAAVALVDSGAAVTCLRADMAPRSVVAKARPSSIRLRSVDDDEVQTLGEVDVVLTVPGSSREVTTTVQLVNQSMGYEAIVGAADLAALAAADDGAGGEWAVDEDFLRLGSNGRARLRSPGNRTTKKRERRVAALSRLVRPPCAGRADGSPIYAQSAKELPPYTMLLMQGMVGDEVEVGRDAVVELNENGRGRAAWAARSAVKPKRHDDGRVTVPVLLANMTPRSVQLRPGEQVAVLQQEEVTVEAEEERPAALAALGGEVVVDGERGKLKVGATTVPNPLVRQAPAPCASPANPDGVGAAAITAKDLDLSGVPPQFTEPEEVEWTKVEESIGRHLSAKEAETIMRMLRVEFKDVFSGGKRPRFGTIKGAEHKIPLKAGTTPIQHEYHRRQPPAYEQYLDDWAKLRAQEGVVERTESPWVAPLVLAEKASGGVRVCYDARKLNERTEVSASVSPSVEPYLEKMGNCRYVSCFDLSQGFWNCYIEPASRPQTAFKTKSGLWRWVRMPFGLSGSPGTFVAEMEKMLSGCGAFSSFFIDDICVWSPTFAEHVDHLRAVLTRVKEAGAMLSVKKTQICREKMSYLGHTVIPGEGVAMDDAKVRDIRALPAPVREDGTVNVTALRSFLGAVNFYSRFIRGYSYMAAPLHALTGRPKKGQGAARKKWTEEHTRAFRRLKRALTTAPVLAVPDFSKMMYVRCDASKRGMAACLAQKDDKGQWRPLAYKCWKLKGNETGYDAPTREACVLRRSILFWRHFLWGRPSVLLSDHRSHQWLKEKRLYANVMIQRCALALLEFPQMDIQFVAGKELADVDGFSRVFDATTGEPLEWPEDEEEDPMSVQDEPGGEEERRETEKGTDDDDDADDSEKGSSSDDGTDSDEGGSRGGEGSESQEEDDDDAPGGGGGRLNRELRNLKQDQESLNGGKWQSTGSRRRRGMKEPEAEQEEESDDGYMTADGSTSDEADMAAVSGKEEESDTEDDDDDAETELEPEELESRADEEGAGAPEDAREDDGMGAGAGRGVDSHRPTQARAQQEESPAAGERRVEGMAVTPENWRLAQESDPTLRKYLFGQDKDVYLPAEGVWTRKSTVRGVERHRVLVPAHWRWVVLQTLHDSAGAGHPGRLATWLAVSRRWWWPVTTGLPQVVSGRRSMRQEVVSYVRSCVQCAARKRKGPGRPPLGRVPATGVGHMLALDLVTEMKGKYRYALVMTEMTSRFCVVAPMKSKRAECVAWKLLKHYYALFGPPRVILSDQGTEFAGEAVRELNAALKVAARRTSPYNPACNGLAERQNQTVCNKLAHYANREQTDWHKFAPQVAAAYNGSVHHVTQMTPNFLVFGEERDDALSATLGRSERRSRQELKEARRKINEALSRGRQFALKATEAAQDRRQEDAAKKYPPTPDFEPGQAVMVFYPNLRAEGAGSHLAARWAGPFRILRKMSPQLYSVEMWRRGERLEQRISARRLKLMPLRTEWDIGGGDLAGYLAKVPPPEGADAFLDGEEGVDWSAGEREFELERIGDYRVTTTEAGGLREEFLCYWKGFGDAAASWEPRSHLGTVDEVLPAFWQEAGMIEPKTAEEGRRRFGTSTVRRWRQARARAESARGPTTVDEARPASVRSGDPNESWTVEQLRRWATWKQVEHRGAKKAELLQRVRQRMLVRQ